MRKKQHRKIETLSRTATAGPQSILLFLGLLIDQHTIMCLQRLAILYNIVFDKGKGEHRYYRLFTREGKATHI